MAEQINKNDYINHPDRIGGFNYYSLGETTIKQLQQNNLISSKTRKFQNKKPDAIVTDDEKDIVVYIENKDIGKLSTADDIQSAIDQEIDVAKAVNAPIFVVTDTVDTYWINTLTGERIISEDGTELRVVFKPNENKRQLEKLIKYIRLSISATNNQLKKVVYLDPTDLATAVHQKIWIAKNSSPETCLYTFVELFIFKYLSDLGVLTGDYSFDSLCKKYEDEGNSDEYVLDFYLGTTGPREKIKSLFPEGVDGTTVVNGDVFHAIKNKDGEYVVNGDGKTFIYSANNNEPLAYANFFDYDGSFLTISVNGIAGRITKKEGKFSINADRVILVPLVENIDLDYIRFTVEPILRSKIKGRMGHDGQNEFTKLPGGTIERVKISIPIKEDGSFDLEAQQEIANKYRKIQQINSSIYQQIDELINIKIAL